MADRRSSRVLQCFVAAAVLIALLCCGVLPPPAFAAAGWRRGQVRRCPASSNFAARAGLEARHPLERHSAMQASRRSSGSLFEHLHAKANAGDTRDFLGSDGRLVLDERERRTLRSGDDDESYWTRDEDDDWQEERVSMQDEVDRRGESRRDLDAQEPRRAAPERKTAGPLTSQLRAEDKEQLDRPAAEREPRLQRDPMRSAARDDSEEDSGAGMAAPERKRAGPLTAQLQAEDEEQLDSPAAEREPRLQRNPMRSAARDDSEEDSGAGMAAPERKRAGPLTAQLQAEDEDQEQIDRPAAERDAHLQEDRMRGGARDDDFEEERGAGRAAPERKRAGPLTAQLQAEDEDEGRPARRQRGDEAPGGGFLSGKVKQAIGEARAYREERRGFDSRRGRRQADWDDDPEEFGAGDVRGRREERRGVDSRRGRRQSDWDDDPREFGAGDARGWRDERRGFDPRGGRQRDRWDDDPREAFGEGDTRGSWRDDRRGFPPRGERRRGGWDDDPREFDEGRFPPRSERRQGDWDDDPREFDEGEELEDPPDALRNRGPRRGRQFFWDDDPRQGQEPGRGWRDQGGRGAPRWEGRRQGQGRYGEEDRFQGGRGEPMRETYRDKSGKGPRTEDFAPEELEIRRTGRVDRWVNDMGLGWIVPDDGGPHVFVHIKGFAWGVGGANGMKGLREGETIEYTLMPDPKDKSRLIAWDVTGPNGGPVIGIPEDAARLEDVKTELFVGNLAPHTDGRTLKRHFEQVCRVARASVTIDGWDEVNNRPFSKRWAVVRFYSRWGAEEAMRKLDGSLLDGARIQVNEYTGGSRKRFERDDGAPLLPWT